MSETHSCRVTSSQRRRDKKKKVLSWEGDAGWGGVGRTEEEMEILLPSLSPLPRPLPARRCPHHCALIPSHKVSADVSDGGKGSVYKEGGGEPTAL